MQRLLGVGAVGKLFERKLFLRKFGLLVLLLDVELLDLLLGGLGALGLDRLKVAFLDGEVVTWLELELLGRHQVLHESWLVELLTAHHVVLLAGVELVGVELLRDAALRVLPLLGHGVHADLLVGALLRVRHRAMH